MTQQPLPSSALLLVIDNNSDDDHFSSGEIAYASNPKYKDGTRLRIKPDEQKDGNFNGIWLQNDSKVEILQVVSSPAISGSSDSTSSSSKDVVLFAKVRKEDGGEGWIRCNNLTKRCRVPGIAKGVISNEIVTPDPEYIKGIKIYGVGILQDPVPGQKMGKGLQHLISSQWLMAMSEFVASHFGQMQAFAIHAYEGQKQYLGYDYLYFTNMANELFLRADVQGLHTSESIDYFLAAAWLIMAAAEVDDFPFRKYTTEQRNAQKVDFYSTYLSPRQGPGVVDVKRDDASLLGKFSAPLSRRDLLPPIALERLGLNNELSALKYLDPEEPLREGFLLSVRIDSLKRHFEAVHRRLVDEDHIIHLLWNMHAIYHVNVVYPEKNNLINYLDIINHKSTVPTRRTAYDPTTSLEKISQSYLPLSSVLKLDWNEGVIPPPPSVRAALVNFVQAAEGNHLKWYPHLSGGSELLNALASYCGVIVENLLVTNGSDDALILLCHAILGSGKTTLVPSPTYEHFCVNSVNTGASLIRLNPEGDPFTSNVDTLATSIEKCHPDLVYLVSPNNPTGVEWSSKDVHSLAMRYPNVKFLVDEAYHEFATVDPSTGKPVTCVSLAVQLPNVIVTRTFSKAFCLAAVRCGYIVAHPNTIESLRSFYNPKSVNELAQIAALHALLEFKSYYQPYISSTNIAREWFIKDLVQKGVVVRSGGGGNFVCVQVPQGKTHELCQKLEEKAIYVRDITGRFSGYIRVTIGLDMSRVSEAIVSALKDLELL